LSKRGGCLKRPELRWMRCWPRPGLPRGTQGMAGGSGLGPPLELLAGGQDAFPPGVPSRRRCWRTSGRHRAGTARRQTQAGEISVGPPGLSPWFGGDRGRRCFARGFVRCGRERPVLVSSGVRSRERLLAPAPACCELSVRGWCLRPRPASPSRLEQRERRRSPCQHRSRGRYQANKTVQLLHNRKIHVWAEPGSPFPQPATAADAQTSPY
jgi:hypothetical protein